MPNEYGFPGLEKGRRGLVELDAIEQGGLVWIDHDGGGVNGDGLLHVPELLRPDDEFLESFDFEVDANWKVLAEGFLEGYHLRATHPGTFLPFGYGNLTVVERSGPHNRVTFPFRRVEALREPASNEVGLDGAITTVDHVFPNVMVARLSYHTTMVMLEPLAVNRTREIIYRLSSTSAGRSGGSDAQRDSDFVAQGAAEDLAIAGAVQRGLASGANDFLEFGRFESAIGRFHSTLAQALSSTELESSSTLRDGPT